MQILTKFKDSLTNNLKYSPVAIAIDYTLVAILIFITFTHSHYSSYIDKSIPFLILGYFLFAGLHLLNDKRYLIIGGLAWVVYFLVYAPYFATSYFIFQSIYLIIATILFLFVVPFFGKRVSNLEIYSWVKWVVFSLFSSGLLAGLLSMALMVAFGAIDMLLGLKIGGSFYGTVTILIFGVFGGNYFLEQLRAYDPNQKPLESKISPIIAKYILPAFAIFYLTILYLYSAKILITASWPRGALAWFILFFSLVTLSAHFNLIPYKKEKLQRIFLIAIIPQAFMLLLAVYKRIEAYSFTESRYLLVVYGLFLIVGSFYLLLKKETGYRLFFILAIVAILFSQIGFTSGYHISRVAQTKRLESNLKLLENNSSTELKREISSSLYYLIQHYGIDGVKESLPGIVKKYRSNPKRPLFPKSSYNADIEYFVAKELGFEYKGKGYQSYSSKSEQKDIVNFYCKRDFIDVKGYDYLIGQDYVVFYNENREEVYRVGSLEVRLKRDKITLKSPKGETKLDLKSFIKKLFKNKECLVYENREAGVKFIPVDDVDVRESSFKSLQFMILIRER